MIKLILLIAVVMAVFFLVKKFGHMAFTDTATAAKAVKPSAAQEALRKALRKGT